MRNINEASAVYMPYKPVQRFIGHQAEEMERLSSALKKHGIDCGPLQVNISVSYLAPIFFQQTFENCFRFEINIKRWQNRLLLLAQF